MHKERLQQMVTMLRELPREPNDGRPGFDIGSWNCGTTACAVGHACLDPVFIEQGLGFDSFAPAFEDALGFDAVELFFGITHVQAAHLFASDCYPHDGRNTTATDVANRIEEFIAGNVEV